MASTFGQLQHLKSSLAERAPFRWLHSQHVNQILLMGLEGAGKTTLLYRLKIPSWRPADMCRELQSLKEQGGGDPAYHFEEFASQPLAKYGIWDIPGSEAFQRVWPMFYRYIKVAAVIFVVDNYSGNDNLEKIFQARDALHVLLNEDELRQAAFIVIQNIKDEDYEKDPTALKESEKALDEVLGIPSLMEEAAQRRRLFRMSMDCSKVTHESRTWQSLLREISAVQSRMS